MGREGEGKGGEGCLPVGESGSASAVKRLLQNHTVQS